MSDRLELDRAGHNRFHIWLDSRLDHCFYCNNICLKRLSLNEVDQGFFANARHFGVFAWVDVDSGDLFLVRDLRST